ncbi:MULTISPECIES: preprotein translocase subunit YajC [Thalassobaculum]|jgi:preprotein translocase subunit YajC|uniref:Sec translocon accessory complex subunit YajC n=1 Tax=Thalassobaculum litoreum DSM 18839 TaxID=1123362 RepID=A0A8G2BEW9_9PROT|nr:MULTISPECIES: preprotein translocase subunit YajC [Thalassobaculum]SDF16341.1 protein translocase subunit yajC [Thalassobaculum litoreum DSM 18839]
MLISTAHAQSLGGGSGDFLVQLLPLVLIFVVFYFLLIRPQQKRMKQHKEMLANVRRGDRIVGNGGLMGTVTKVSDDDDTLTVEIADGVRVQMLRSMLAEVRGKGEPVSKPPKKKAGKAEAAANEDASEAEPAPAEVADGEKSDKT